jgi:hypothetical protein
LVVCIGLIFAFAGLHSIYKRIKAGCALHVPSYREWVGNSDRLAKRADECVFNASSSGRWTGYFVQFNCHYYTRKLDLNFDGSGQVTGSGSDRCGKFWVRGIYSDSSRRVAFSKRYWHCGGVVPSYYTVEYRGALVDAGTGTDSLARGLRGRWYLRGLTAQSERFHLWPAMAGWDSSSRDSSCNSSSNNSCNSSNNSSNSSRSHYYMVVDADGSSGRSSLGECAVCFDRQIDTGLVPCGHVALCRQCADTLVRDAAENRHDRATCPICRATVQALEDLGQSRVVESIEHHEHGIC